MTQAIFLSYSSDDADAARRICDALRAAGLEVWFDQSELRGGDVWDASIRKQIKECALFVPIISASTEQRFEGYFRLEWRLADQRTHLIGRNKAFLVPVCIDDTKESNSDVPESFLNVQWTRLPNGETSRQFAERLKSLKRAGPASGALTTEPDAPRQAVRSQRGAPWKRNAMIAVAIVALLAVAGVMSFRYKLQAPSTVDTATAISTNSEEARKLAEQARNIGAAFHSNVAELEAAAALAERALALDPTSADLLAIASQIDTRLVRSDRTPERIERARSRSAKAMTFAPTAYEPRLAQASFQVSVLGQPYSNSADNVLQTLRKENPADFRAVFALASLRFSQGRFEDQLKVYEDAAKYPALAGGALIGKAAALTLMERFDEAMQAATLSIAAKQHPSNLTFMIWLQMSWQGDLDGALATMKSMSVDDQLDDMGLSAVSNLYRWRREPGNVLKTLRPISRDWLASPVRAPKAALLGDAYEELGQMDAARAEWRTALKTVDDRLVAAPNDRSSLEWKAYLSAALGDPAAARQAWKQAVGLPGGWRNRIEKIQRIATPDEIIAELETRASAPALPDGGAERQRFISAAELRLNPAWDRVRKLPRFQALQARLDQDPRFSPQAAARARGVAKP